MSCIEIPLIINYNATHKRIVLKGRFHLKIRYTHDEKGRYREELKIYDSEKDLHIPYEKLEEEALRVLQILQEEGFKSYFVGGCVRDLILGLTPKDFDITTEAYPQQIKMIFGRRASIIGKRFRLVHVKITPKNYIEVVTFRTTREKSLSNNSYGTIDEDVKRRDFAFNALFYNPFANEVLDYINGVDSIKKKIIEPVIPSSIIFKEDPVRIIRLIKYSVKTDFKIPLKLKWQVFKDKGNLRKIPTARLMDEFLKILHSGFSENTFKALHKYGVLAIITPNLNNYLNKNIYFEVFTKELQKLDKKVNQNSYSNPPMKEDFMRPIRQLGKKIFKLEYEERGKKLITLNDLLEEIFFPIHFTGEWNLALKNLPPKISERIIKKISFHPVQKENIKPEIEANKAKKKKKRPFNKKKTKKDLSLEKD